ncbi:MAG: YopX family protein [Lachnospiraceae bacterium]
MYRAKVIPRPGEEKSLWVKGDLVHIGRNTFIHPTEMGFRHDNEKTNQLALVPVIMDTVCLSSGLHDADGQEIWENDIVLASDTPMRVLFKEAQFVLYPYGIHCIPLNSYGSDDLERIGNIFDTPELMENRQTN